MDTGSTRTLRVLRDVDFTFRESSRPAGRLCAVREQEGRKAKGILGIEKNEIIPRFSRIVAPFLGNVSRDTSSSSLFVNRSLNNSTARFFLRDLTRVVVLARTGHLNEPGSLYHEKDPAI